MSDRSLLSAISDQMKYSAYKVIEINWIGKFRIKDFYIQSNYMNWDDIIVIVFMENSVCLIDNAIIRSNHFTTLRVIIFSTKDM
jgi:hypothetical protein